MISTIGRIRDIDFPVIVTGRDDDYTPLVGLDVLIAHAGGNLDSVVDVADKIARHSPRELECWNVLDGQMVGVFSLYKKSINRNPIL